MEDTIFEDRFKMSLGNGYIDSMIFVTPRFTARCKVTVIVGNDGSKEAVNRR